LDNHDPIRILRRACCSKVQRASSIKSQNGNRYEIFLPQKEKVNDLLLFAIVDHKIILNPIPRIMEPEPSAFIDSNIHSVAASGSEHDALSSERSFIVISDTP
jgi:hypothetical protein